MVLSNEQHSKGLPAKNSPRRKFSGIISHGVQVSGCGVISNNVLSPRLNRGSAEPYHDFLMVCMTRDILAIMRLVFYLKCHHSWVIKATVSSLP